MKKLAFLSSLLALSTAAFSEMRTISFVPEHIAIGNAGQNVLFVGAGSVLGGVPTNGRCDEWGRTYFYIELSDERARHFEAAAMTAKATGTPIMLYYNDAMPEVIMQWVGLTGCKIENLRMEG